LKPGRKDIKLEVLIAGPELAALKELTPDMAESYGLDRRIETYRGTRPIGLYRWDLDCLLCVLEWNLSNASRFNLTDVEALQELHSRLREQYVETWEGGLP
jgi:hypothetical protein